MKTRLVLAWVIANAGCAMTATMREGPARPAAELATVDSRDTIIAEVDGKDVRYIRADANAGSVYLLPAGPHVIGFSLRMRSGGPGHILRSPYIRVCLLAEAGHYYTTTAEVAVDTWRPHIIDGAGGEVPLTCDQTEAEIVDLWSQAKIERQKSHPQVDVMATVGYDDGGENVVRAQFSNGSSQTLAAGQGPFFRVGAMVTPLWLADDHVGLGAGADVAFKLDTVSVASDSVALIRYPSSFTLHTLISFNPVWYLLIAGGVEQDLGISVSRTGDVSSTGGASLTSRIGGVGRLGLYWADTDTFGIMSGFEYTKVSYDAPGRSVRADNAGFWTTLTWRPF